MDEKDLLRGLIELHVHSSPDTEIRKFTDIELAKQMKASGARAVVLKSHTFPTVGRAAIASQVADFPVYGSITLNEEVGGFNPRAVKTALDLGAKTVWMPTKSAANHKRYFGKEGGLSALENGKVRKDLEEILELIAEKNAILSMGHLSVEEQKLVAAKAKTVGVKKIVVDHPELALIGMTVEEQKYMVQFDVCFLRCAVYLDLSRSYPDVLRNVRALGCSTTILSTDGGNVGLPDWSNLMREYLQYLFEHGVTEEELNIMTRINPRKFLDLQ